MLAINSEIRIAAFICNFTDLDGEFHQLFTSSLLNTKYQVQIFQKQITLRERKRGFHLVTDEIISAFPELKYLNTGLLQVFMQHTSASLSINENADPTVRMDFEMWFNKAVPENDPDYRHDYEGDDDMPAHIKSALLDTSLLIPITNGKLALGTWQGIYLCEHRNRGGNRKIVVTAWGT